LFDRQGITDVHTYNMRAQTVGEQPADVLFELPCACQNLRRLSRVVTRIYDEELRRAGLEITQFGLLTALATVGEANQKRLSAGFAMDSTTLTRTLGLLRKQGWIRARRGKDRRERLFSLTGAGKRQMAMAQPHWERAERRLRKGLGDAGWKNMKRTVFRMTEAGMSA
jgi:DNA-binding MarR family transcriptional regulator